MSGLKKSLVFVWENFGPMHVDRCEAIAVHYAGRRDVVGIELGGVSQVYGWTASSTKSFSKVTVFAESSVEGISFWRRFYALVKTCVHQGRADFFFCHYEQLEVFLTVIALRLLGQRVYLMNDSKFDDKPRSIMREVGKTIALWPYSGALVSGRRSKEYLTFLLFSVDRIATGYDTLSIERIRRLAAADPAPKRGHFEERHFTVIARFVPKKNLPMLMDAYANYVRSVSVPRLLHLCGAGEMEDALREQALRLGVQNLVVFRGLIQTEEVALTLANTLALILVSVEEQFGLVVIEAQAMGVPVIFTAACGARDELLRSGVNGFLVEADNPVGVAYFMKLIASDEGLWRRLARGALEAAPLGDVARFVSAVEQLTEGSGAH